MSEQPKRPTKVIYDMPTNTFQWVYDEVDASITEVLSEYRMNICKSCKHIQDQGNGVFRCNHCGCHLEYKVKMIYPLDEDGKAFKGNLPDGNHRYVCGIKNW